MTITAAVLAALLIATVLCGCTPSRIDRRDRPFTREWTHQQRTQERVREQGLDPEFRKKGDNPLGLETDERGKPSLSVGSEHGLGVDIGRRGRTGLRYRREWDFVKPDNRAD